MNLRRHHFDSSTFLQEEYISNYNGVKFLNLNDNDGSLDQYHISVSGNNVYVKWEDDTPHQ